MDGQIIRRGLDAEVRGLGSGEFSARISTAALDRDREVLMPAGCRSKDYERNPVVLWNHDTSLPVGRCMAIRRDNYGVVATAMFAERPEGYQGDFFPDFVRALVSQGIVKGVSVGFISRERRSPTKADIERWGDSLQNVHTKWDLLEFSLVSLPSNPEALVTAVGKGVVTADQCRKWMGVDVAQPVPHRRRIVVSLNPAVAVRGAIRSAMSEEMRRRRGSIWLS